MIHSIDFHWTYSNERTNVRSLLQASDEINAIYEIQEYSKHPDLLAEACVCARARDQRPAVARFSLFKMNLRANFSERRAKV